MYRLSLFILGAVVLLVSTVVSIKPLYSKKESAAPFEMGDFETVRYRYTLYDPEEAPEDIRSQVVHGFKLMLETNKHLPDHVGNQLNCTNCHFSGGNTFGGKQNGLSLVGVSHLYPKKLQSGKEESLAERVNGCFLRSMNGKPLSLEGEDMKAFVTYLDWISKGIPELPDYPWLGIKHFRTHHTPDPTKGAKIFASRCAMCHGKEGQGQQRPDDLSYPPVWGDQSFNDAAGMNHIETFAYFVYENMPYGSPDLTIEEALDVAEYVTSRPRPHFEQGSD